MKKITDIKVLKVIAGVFTAFSIILLLLPSLWMLSSAMKDNIEIYRTPPKFFPPVPQTLQVDVYYPTSEMDLEMMKKDAVFIIWGVVNEYRESNIQRVEVRSFTEQGASMKISATKNIVQESARNVLGAVNYRSVTVTEKYEELLEICKISFLKSNTVINTAKGTITAELSEYINTNFLLTGEIRETRFVSSPSLYLANFISAWKQAGEQDASESPLGFGRFLINSLFVSVMAIVCQLTISSLAGYSLSKIISGTLSKVILLFFLATSMIPFIATLLPQYIIFSQLGLADSLWALILPTTSFGFAIYLYKGFFDQLPMDLIHAAKIDGANEIYTFIKIVLPISKPVFGVVSLWTFLGVWNDFMWPNIILTRPEVWTYTVALYKIQSLGAFTPNFSMALNCIAILPTLSIMLFFQKGIQKGLVFGAVKG